MKIWKIVQSQYIGLYSGWILPDGKVVDIRSGGGLNSVIHGQYVRNNPKLFGLKPKDVSGSMDSICQKAYEKQAVRIAKFLDTIYIEGMPSAVRNFADKIHTLAKNFNVRQVTYHRTDGTFIKTDVEGIYSI